MIIRLPIAALLAAITATAHAQVSAPVTPESLVAAAKRAAGQDHAGTFLRICVAPDNLAPRPQAAAPGLRAVPDRATWYAAPYKVFDDLYFVGTKIHSAWALTTSEGIIVIDTLFDYAVEEEVGGGLKKLGLDPATIRYAVVTHPHPDHHGGAKFLQDRYRTRVVMSGADWDVIERLGGTAPGGAVPSRDSLVSSVATDGQQLTLGDTTVTLYITPGHTPGTLSVVIPVREGGRPHVAALWGGTGLNADRESLEHYVRSAQRFDGIARQAGADIVLSNHTDWDGSKVNLPRLASRAPGDSNPYVVGAEAVRRYLTVARECATSRVMRLK